MDWSRLTDPTYDPYSGLWDVLHVRDVLSVTGIDPSTATTIVLVTIAIVCLIVSRVYRRPAPASSRLARDERDDRDVVRPTNTHWLRRLWWRVRLPADLMKIDGLAIDRTRKPHCAWLGPTGAGKSSAVAVVRVDGARPTLAAMPDVSDPIREAAERIGQADGRAFVWTACQGWPQRPIDFLIGTPQEVAERLTEVFRSGGTGAWKRAARRVTAQVITQIDDEGLGRNLSEIGERVREVVKHDKNLSLVCAGWVDRFLDMADQFGESIGPDGEDLAELLRAGYTIVLDVDAFDHPSLGGDVVALGLAEAKRCASLVPGGFRLIFEEAGQLGERIDLAEPFHRAGRRRKIAVDDITQAESDLNEGISANIATRVYFAQELKSLQRTAADRLGIDYRNLDPANMRDFTAWVTHGKIRRLVRFPKPPKVRNRNQPDFRTGGDDYRPGSLEVVPWEEPGPGAGTEVVDAEPRVLPERMNGAYMLPGARREPPSYVAGSERRVEIWGRLRGTWRPSGCWLWPEDAGRNKAYGKTSYLNRSGWETHFLFWAWKVIEDHELGRQGDLEVFYARHPDVPRFEWPTAGGELVVLLELKKWMQAQTHVKKLSIDHKCPGGPNTLCQNADYHLWLATGTENSSWRHVRRTGAGRLKLEAESAAASGA